MGIIFFLLGLGITIVGAIPPGAANLILLHQTTQKNINNVRQYVIAAGIGEISLIILALFFDTKFTLSFQNNLWIQQIAPLVFFIAGIYFLTHQKPLKNSQKNGFKNLASYTGFLSALINPPVLLFWLVVIAMINKYLVTLDISTPLTDVLLFLSGAFTGKIVALAMYYRIGKKFESYQKDNKLQLHKIIGICLISVGITQGIRLWINSIQ